MFQTLTEKFERVFKQLRSHGKLTETNIEATLREVRLGLLDADVNFRVVKTFLEKVKVRAVGTEVLKSLTPAQQIIKIIHEELTRLLGGHHHGLNFSNIPPTILMMVGLNGAGKTTAAAKIARHLKAKGRSVELVAADVYRPAAADQLEVLAGSIDVPVFRGTNESEPVETCLKALSSARNRKTDTLILDTAGRMHVDDQMMEEVVRIREATSPHEILFVADSMTGQDAVNAAVEFKKRLDFTGVILTKLDGDARGGAALSICEVTGVQIKFVGVGEKLDALEPFHPERMASRILGMGDVLSLVERAEKAVSAEKASALEAKLRKETFGLDDFLEQLQQIKTIGPIDQLLDMIPGAGKGLKGVQPDERALIHTEAIVRSMTLEERRKPHILNGSRRRRVARGSGRSVQDVNRLLKQFQQMQKMMKSLGRLKTGHRLQSLFG
jgi:signal recognition particle subunit SRP54